MYVGQHHSLGDDFPLQVSGSDDEGLDGLHETGTGVQDPLVDLQFDPRVTLPRLSQHLLQSVTDKGERERERESELVHSDMQYIYTFLLEGSNECMCHKHRWRINTSCVTLMICHIELKVSEYTHIMCE